MENIEKQFNELWNEHDGTHFYKDEWKEFVLHAYTTGIKDAIRAVEKSRTLDEKYGRGIKEETARKQCVVSLQALIKEQ